LSATSDSLPLSLAKLGLGFLGPEGREADKGVVEADGDEEEEGRGLGLGKWPKEIPPFFVLFISLPLLLLSLLLIQTTIN